MYEKLRQHDKVDTVKQLMLTQGVEPDFYILNALLSSAIRKQELGEVKEILEMFLQYKCMPLHWVMKHLLNLNPLPMDLWYILQKFDAEYIPEMAEKARAQYDSTNKEYFTQ